MSTMSAAGGVARPLLGAIFISGGLDAMQKVDQLTGVLGLSRLGSGWIHDAPRLGAKYLRRETRIRSLFWLQGRISIVTMSR